MNIWEELTGTNMKKYVKKSQTMKNENVKAFKEFEIVPIKSNPNKTTLEEIPMHIPYTKQTCTENLERIYKQNIPKKKSSYQHIESKINKKNELKKIKNVLKNIIIIILFFR